MALSLPTVTNSPWCGRVPSSCEADFVFSGCLLAWSGRPPGVCAVDSVGHHDDGYFHNRTFIKSWPPSSRGALRPRGVGRHAAPGSHGFIVVMINHTDGTCLHRYYSAKYSRAAAINPRALLSRAESLVRQLIDFKPIPKAIKDVPADRIAYRSNQLTQRVRAPYQRFARAESANDR